MKRFLCAIIASMIILTCVGNVVSLAENSDIQNYIPDNVVISADNEGYGLFDNMNSNPAVVFSEHGISENILRIQYNESTDKIVYSYVTGATDLASEIGMLPIQLQMLDPSTSNWVNITSGSPKKYNTYTASGTYSRGSLTHGRYYRVTGYHYAKINGTTYKLYNETNAVYVD